MIMYLSGGRVYHYFLEICSHEIKWAASGVINAVIKFFQYIGSYEKTLMQLLFFYGKLNFRFSL